MTQQADDGFGDFEGTSKPTNSSLSGGKAEGWAAFGGAQEDRFDAIDDAFGAELNSPTKYGGKTGPLQQADNPPQEIKIDLGADFARAREETRR